jgi:hypothetical protein
MYLTLLSREKCHTAAQHTHPKNTFASKKIVVKIAESCVRTIYNLATILLS